MKRIVIEGIKNYLHKYFELTDHIPTHDWRQNEWKTNINLGDFLWALSDTDHNEKIGFIEQYLTTTDFEELLKNIGAPCIVFDKNNDYQPIIIAQERKSRTRNKIAFLSIDKETGETQYIDNKAFNDCNLATIADLSLDFNYAVKTQEITTDNDIFTLSSYSILPYFEQGNEENAKKKNPFQKLLALLAADKREIWYVYFYAILSGLISVLLPLSMQAIVNYVSGGEILNVIMVLIVAVILGTVVAGVLQIVQMTLVEVLQRRIFVKIAFEYAYRIPRIKESALYNYFTPELVNRFFDVLTIQKALPKVLIDITSNTLQIIFGLILLSFYHPFFVGLSFVLIIILFLIFRFMGPKGLQTSILESDYKYKLVHWLQEVAKSAHSFKIAGFTNAPVHKTDFLVRNYLNARSKHFQILRTQYSALVVFKVLIIASLLIFGTVLVTERTISLGQFLATEIVVILLLGAVEKLILSLDVVYDILTACEKVSKLTNLPLEKQGGLQFPKQNTKQGVALKTINLSLKLPQHSHKILENINFEIKENEKVWVRGSPEKLKAFSQVLQGFYDYEGNMRIDGLSSREIGLTHWRDILSVNYHKNEIFEGSIEENISMGKNHITLQDVFWAVEKTGLADWVYALPEGLRTQILAGGKGITEAYCSQIMVARCIAERPRMVIFNTELIQDLPVEKQKDIINLLFDGENKWSLLLFCTDEKIGKNCDKTFLIT